MTTLLMEPFTYPSATAASLQVRERFVGLARKEAEAVIRDALTSEETVAVLEACLEQARLAFDALESLWRQLSQHLQTSVVGEDDLEWIVDATLKLLSTTEVLLGLVQQFGGRRVPPHSTGSDAAKELTRLDHLRSECLMLKRSLDASPPKLSPEGINQLCGGLEEMKRGEGEYVEDVLARLLAGGEE